MRRIVLSRWPIFALISLAWIFLTFIIPFIANFILDLPEYGGLLNPYVKFFIPISIFIVFLYLWYKLTEYYYRKKAIELRRRE